MTRGVKNHTIRIQFFITLATQEHLSASIMFRVRYDPLAISMRRRRVEGQKHRLISVGQKEREGRDHD